jgi:DNA-binding NtrC family response regulator
VSGGRKIDLSDLAGDEAPAATEQLVTLAADARTVRRFVLELLTDSPRRYESSADRASIGSHESNDVVIDDPSVSRFHCEVLVDAGGVRVRDLDSKNGTIVDGMRVVEAWLRPGAILRLGRSSLRFGLAGESNRLTLSSRTSFGALVGQSASMRAAFALLERAAASDATVLIEGETGTGKEGAAQSLHDEGARAGAPFLVIDCSAVPANLLESELFGHERGAFTGAVTRRVGIFEGARGGTVFLDEIGELPLELQPKLLRVLEKREIRRVGANTTTPVDVRVVAATNRDLRAEVNAGRFRSDLYFRLAVVRVALPPLRQRPEDVPLLVMRFLDGLRATPAQRALFSPELLNELARGAWPGNVRELRNYVERCLVLQDAPAPGEIAGSDAPALALGEVSVDVPWATARERAIAAFERRYLEALLARHDGHVGRAAEGAGMNKVYLYRLLHRHGLMPD